MIRALYGVRIREAYTPEFGFSGRLGSQFLAQHDWNDAADGGGIELRLTLSAITGGYRICQSFLGDKDHVERRGSDLVPALRQTAGILFSALEADFPVWSSVAGSQAPPTTGTEQKVLLAPFRVNRKRLREMFTTGVAELDSVFQSILSPSTLAELQRDSPPRRRGIQLLCAIVGQDSLRVCRRVPEVCDQSRPYHSGPGPAFPRESADVRDREPQRFCGRRREQYRRLMP